MDPNETILFLLQVISSEREAKRQLSELCDRLYERLDQAESEVYLTRAA